MENMEKIRSKQNKKAMKAEKMKKSRRRRSTPFIVFVNCMKVLVLLMFVAAIGAGVWVYNQFDFTFGDDFSVFTMRLSSTIYCKDASGQYVEYDQFKSSDKRIWVDYENIPQGLKDAFVAIEDQRFYEHNGVDLKRTIGAVLNVFMKGDSSYGGSTITQQLIKNITSDNERTSARKIREITRAIVLEQKLSKEEILELYMNSIYLSQGVHGVEAAANVYFDKSVDQLTIAECASIAGITQYPTTYDPILHPQNNRKKQLTVLAKMLELGFIDDNQYDDAIEEELDIQAPPTADGSTNPEEIQSYFTDHIFEQAKADLMKEFGYNDSFAEDYLCNGGLKIYATVDLGIQNKLEAYYCDDSNFPQYGGEKKMESAIILCDPFTGELKAVVGGRGQKGGNRVLNRATQSKRQPGSTIKPIAVYTPALEENIINLASSIDNSKTTWPGNWTPANANGKYSGPVPLKTAVAYSYNVPAVKTLEALTIDKSFEYMHDKMHVKSLVDEGERNDNYTDRNLPCLALGGLTEGVTPLEMSAAYCTIANGGMYIEPTSYTKILDKDDKLIYEKKQTKNRVFSEATAFLSRELLKNVVSYGTAAGSAIKGMDTCGKTGTTDDNKDKWFIGFTPYYCATVWTGFDNPRVMSGSNPALAVWREVMTDIHAELDEKHFEQPDTVVKARVCAYTGLKASGGCGSTEFANTEHMTGYCRGIHNKKFASSGKKSNSDDDKKKEEKKPEEPKPEETEQTESTPDSTGSSSTGGQTEQTTPPPDPTPDTSAPSSTGGINEQTPAPSNPTPDTSTPAPAPAPAPQPEPQPAPTPDNSGSAAPSGT